MSSFSNSDGLRHVAIISIQQENSAFWKQCPQICRWERLLQKQQDKHNQETFKISNRRRIMETRDAAKCKIKMNMHHSRAEDKRRML
jgi:hypothetical protein